MASADYILKTRRLLHDANSNYWSDTDLLDAVNQARKRIGLDTGSLRSLVNFYLSAGQEAYPFSGAIANISISAAGTGFSATPTISFSGGGGSGATATLTITSGTVSGVTITANGSGYTAAPTCTISGGGGGGAAASATIMQALDILSISVNWGGSWITLAHTFFSQFQARARMYRNTTGQPSVWTNGPPPNTSGSDYFYVYNVPSTSYQADIDAIVTPDPLVNDSTAEQLQYPYTDLVPYYAAYIAKFMQQQFDDAAQFLQLYEKLKNQYIASRYQRRIPNPYA